VLLESVSNFKVDLLGILIEIVVGLTFGGRYVLHDNDLEGKLIEARFARIDIKVDTGDFFSTTIERTNYCLSLNLLAQWNSDRHRCPSQLSDILANVINNVLSLAKSHMLTCYNLELHPAHTIQIFRQHLIPILEH
jgi:hypothetical protein